MTEDLEPSNSPEFTPELQALLDELADALAPATSAMTELTQTIADTTAALQAFFMNLGTCMTLVDKVAQNAMETLEKQQAEKDGSLC